MTETRLFRIALAVALVHALDDAFVHRGPGLGLGQHALAGVLALGAGVAAMLAFPLLRPGLRALLALAFGGLAVVNGALHLRHLEHGASGGDLTGVLAAAAGVVLVGLAVAIPWRHRGEGSWTSRAIAVPGTFLALLLVLVPVAMGVVATHKWREPVGDPPRGGYQSVEFEATDGLGLAGWYRPSSNGAAVIVVHGGSSDRKGSRAHAEMLARRGYGVLLYDARGRGESDGSENNYGWDWAKDVAGALRYVESRPDVEPGRIGAVGLSTGADVLLEVAGERSSPLAAVVADGAAAGSFEDWARLRGTELGTVPGWVMFGTIQVLSGDPPGPPLEDLVARIEAPTLLVSAGEAEERDFNELYERAGSEAVTHWNLPDAQHTRALREFPQEYEQRVVGFLDRELAVE